MFCPRPHPPEYYKKPVYLSESFVIVNGTKVRCVTYGLSQKELDRIDREIKATQVYKPPSVKVWSEKGGWLTFLWDPHLSWYKPFGRMQFPKVRRIFPRLISQ